jgi:hypothetical protein
MQLESTICDLCGYHERLGNSPRCTTCRRLIKQGANSNSNAKRHKRIKSAVAVLAIRESLELGKQLYSDQPAIYACHYTEIPLNTASQSYRQGNYASFDHVIPKNPARLVLCSQIINGIKGSKTDVKFRQYVCEKLDVNAKRSIRNLSLVETSAFLAALKVVMLRDESQIAEARRTLSQLSAIIHFEPKPAAPPGECASSQLCAAS